MTWFVRPFVGRSLGGVLGGLLACSVACSTDPKVSAGNGNNGGANGDGTGRGGTGGSSGGSNNKGGSGGGVTVDLPSANGGSSGKPIDETMCGAQNFQLERLPPELLLVLDRSGSMRSRVESTGNDRWTETTAALDEVLMGTNDAVSWGVKTFPTSSACNVSDTVEVEVKPANYTAVGGFIKMTLPNMDAGGTPTGLAVRNSTAYMRTITTKNPKYIVLATDGEPTCNDQPIDAIREAAGAGFRVFVVGIATAGTGADATLNEMAVTGGEPRDGATKYYPVANKQDLVATLQQITMRVSNCVFPLQSNPPDAKYVAVKVGGQKLPMDGWKYGANMKSIEVTGQYCDMLKAGNVNNVEIIFACAPIP